METFFWLLGEFASLKSKHDSGETEANQQNLLNVIANAVKQSLKATQNVIANKVKQSLKATQNVIANAVKQSFLPCHCEPKARQSSSRLISNRLPRRYAPRNDLGRSMIEMLGVLAIIGVLSVGGIAGYSKAMRMWNSNIQREQITQILHSYVRLRYELRNNQTKSNSIMPILNALGEIPTGMKYNGVLYDKSGNYYSGNFGLTCWKKSQNSEEKVCNYKMYLEVTLVKTDSSLVPSSADLCENVVYVAKENAQDIICVTTFLGNTKDDNDPNHWRGYEQQNAFNSETLKTATPLQIKEMCKRCKNHGFCKVAIYLKTS